MNQVQHREDSSQPTRYFFGLKGGAIRLPNKRSRPASPANSLSGSISEPLHLEPMAPGDRLDPDILLRRADGVGRIGHAATSRTSYGAVGPPEDPVPRVRAQEPMAGALTPRHCTRCLRGPAYHHGHSKDCPKGHYFKRMRAELAMASSTSPVSCRRCIMGPSLHKAHAPNCPRSKYFQRVLKVRDRRDHR